MLPAVAGAGAVVPGALVPAAVNLAEACLTGMVLGGVHFGGVLSENAACVVQFRRPGQLGTKLAPAG
ncbi:hypothetical protein GCM10009768_18870 [Leucobacter iarius]|uniref:Uncharacterized protein n=1 Tax=Leucobacter iarius TaxID=333963 RepID=A0ABP4XV16_9MICO